MRTNALRHADSHTHTQLCSLASNQLCPSQVTWQQRLNTRNFLQTVNATTAGPEPEPGSELRPVQDCFLYFSWGSRDLTRKRRFPEHRKLSWHFSRNILISDAECWFLTSRIFADARLVGDIMATVDAWQAALRATITRLCLTFIVYLLDTNMCFPLSDEFVNKKRTDSAFVQENSLWLAETRHAGVPKRSRDKQWCFHGNPQPFHWLCELCFLCHVAFHSKILFSYYLLLVVNYKWWHIIYSESSFFK